MKGWIALVAAVALIAGDQWKRAREVRACEVEAPFRVWWQQRGQSASCDEGEVRRTVQALREALARLPDDVRVPPFEVLVGARGVRGAAVDRETGMLMVDAQDSELVDPSLWLHELAHVMAHGRRFDDATAEGLADYFAASALGQSALGTHTGEPRDLAASAESVPPSDPRARAHAGGLRIARALWRRHGPDVALARRALAGDAVNLVLIDPENP